MFDWLVASAAIYIVLPDSVQVSYPHVLAIFLLAQIAGLVSNVPGGLGVFETVFILLIGPVASPAELIGSLLAYRIIYYLVPLILAASSLAAFEVSRRAERTDATGNECGALDFDVCAAVVLVSDLCRGSSTVVLRRDTCRKRPLGVDQGIPAAAGYRDIALYRQHRRIGTAVVGAWIAASCGWRIRVESRPARRLELWFHC